MPDETLPTVATINKALTILSKAPPAVATARLEAMHKADPTLYERYVFEKRHGRPAPTADPPAPAPTYHDVVKAVEQRAQHDTSSLDEAWVWLLTAHPAWSPHYRQWQLYDRAAALDKAAREANPVPPLTAAQITQIVKAMPDSLPTPGAIPTDPRAVIATVERLLADMAVGGLTPQQARERLGARQPRLLAAYDQAKNNPAIPALPSNAPTSPDSVKMVRR